MEHLPRSPLLSTKLKIPAPRKNYIVRRKLFQQLSRCSEMSVIFVCGGAGSGKTMLLSTFLHETGLENVRWLTLDSSNTSAGSFWYYFTAAIEPFLQDGEDFLEIMQTTPEVSHMERLLTVLINRLCDSRDCYLVLDDAHFMKDSALLRTFEYFVSNMPESFHLFMLSREEPPIYLSPLAAAGRLLFLDNRQMQLSQEESLAFLKQTLHLAGDDEALGRICNYAEGWVGGLQMAAAAKATGIDSSRLLQAGGGIAAEYLTREIVESLSPEEQKFLQGTGFLSYFDADICSAVFDGFSKDDFQSMIETLTRKNLLLVCLDDQNGVYRYHNILSDYLSQQFAALPEESRKKQHQAAAKAFAAHGDLTEAMSEFCNAGDYQNVLALAHKADGGSDIYGCLEKVPVDVLANDLDLSVQCFQYDYSTANLERCRELFIKLRTIYKDSPVFSALEFGQYYLLENKTAYPTFCVLTEEQIDSLHFSHIAKSLIMTENAIALMEHRRYREAEEEFLLAARVCHGSNALAQLLATNELAQLYEETGQLNRSLACYAKSRRETLLQTNPLSWFDSSIGIIGVYMRRMELDQAANMLQEAKSALEKQLAHQTAAELEELTYYYHVVEMDFLRGDVEKGKTGVLALRAKYPGYGFLTLSRLLYDMACTENLPPEIAEQILQEIEKQKGSSSGLFLHLLRARILMGKSMDKSKEAAKEVEGVLTASRESQNLLRLTEADLLKICVLEQDEETPQSEKTIMNLLCEAVSSATENRILQPFFLERKTLLPLLHELDIRNRKNNILGSAAASFLCDAIAVCGGPACVPKDPEALTSRETEVLQELSRGLTNREIAEKLCISQATVKTHVLSIFGKLDVSTRLMAVEKAREKKLLP